MAGLYPQSTYSELDDASFAKQPLLWWFVNISNPKLIILYTIMIPNWEILFSTHNAHTRSVEEMSEGAATHATVPNEQC